MTAVTTEPDRLSRQIEEQEPDPPAERRMTTLLTEIRLRQAREKQQREACEASDD